MPDKSVIIEIDETKALAMTTLLEDMKARYMDERSKLRLVESMDEAERENSMGHLGHYAQMCAEFIQAIQQGAVVYTRPNIILPDKKRLI